METKVKNWEDAVEEAIDHLDPIGLLKQGVDAAYEEVWIDVTKALAKVGRKNVTSKVVATAIHSAFQEWYGHWYQTVLWEWLPWTHDVVTSILDDPEYLTDFVESQQTK